MTSFSYDNKDSLVRFLSCIETIHDGKIVQIGSDIRSKEWTVVIENEYTSSSIRILFKDVTVFISIGISKWGNDYSISSLTLEEPEETLMHMIEPEMIDINKSLYLVFQLFSGDEIHVICQNVCLITAEETGTVNA